MLSINTGCIAAITTPSMYRMFDVDHNTSTSIANANKTPNNNMLRVNEL